MNRHRDLHALLYAPNQSALLREWLSEHPFNIILTIQPCNPLYTINDMEPLASRAIARIAKAARVRQGLWTYFVAEQSVDRGLWHLHGFVHLKSKKRISWLLRRGEAQLLEVCCGFAAEHGKGFANPSVDVRLIAGSREDIDRCQSYANKQVYRIADRDCHFFGRPQ